MVFTEQDRFGPFASKTAFAGRQNAAAATCHSRRGAPLRHPTPDSAPLRHFSVCRVRGLLQTVFCANEPNRFNLFLEMWFPAPSNRSLK